MYAGNLRSSADFENYLFYWLFPAADGSERPLIVYLSDSPDASPMSALFTEIGPLRVDTSDSDNFHIKYVP